MIIDLYMHKQASASDAAILIEQILSSPRDANVSDTYFALADLLMEMGDTMGEAMMKKAGSLDPRWCRNIFFNVLRELPATKKMWHVERGDDDEIILEAEFGISPHPNADLYYIAEIPYIDQVIAFNDNNNIVGRYSSFEEAQQSLDLDSRPIHQIWWAEAGFYECEIVYDEWIGITSEFGDSRILPAAFRNDTAMYGEEDHIEELGSGYAVAYESSEDTEYIGPFQTEDEAIQAAYEWFAV